LFPYGRKRILLSKTSPERYHQPSSRSDFLDVSKELRAYVSFPCLHITFGASAGSPDAMDNYNARVPAATRHPGDPVDAVLNRAPIV